MNTTQVTSTGIAVAIAVAVALGLLFFGPRIFSPFQPSAQSNATTTDMTASTTAQNTMNPETTNPEAIPNPLPTTLTGSDTVVGTGVEAVAGKTVTVNYVGMLPDGTVFDASANHGQPFSFTLGAGQVIKGWDLGVAGMKVGGKRRLIVPADLAYGNQAVGGVIPANATLIFDVELLDVK
ncbi:MAG: peptidyl-prolyl isomerase, FKBP-type peptidyl-prolyl cis-trans isomerase FkpA [Parcubacteria group bacterium]|nr:peptidyl-prolyl isomerase, FKBP-type peptidyl-prolyl cis-trans isomerase FkpA [Parcubacteria group bacterium]